MLKRLCAIRLRLLLDALTGSGRHRRGMRVLYGFLLLYCVVVFGGLFGLLFWALRPLAEAGLSWLYFALAGILSAGLAFAGSVFMTQQQLYDAQDNQLLLSLPIRPAVVLGSRMLVLYLFDLLLGAVVLVPAVVVYGGTGTFVLRAMLSLVLLPLLPLCLSCFFGWLIGLLTARMRYKNLFSVVLTLLFLGGYLLIYARANAAIQAILLNSQAVAQAVRGFLYPFYLFGMGMAGELRDLLLFFLGTLLLFALVYWILSRTFLHIATAPKKVARRAWRAEELRAGSVGGALLRKELGRFFGSSVYLLNAGIGALLMLVGAAALVVKRADLLEAAGEIGALNPDLLPAVAIFIICFCCGTVDLTTSSISLEGKNLWILKSLPVTPREILRAKLLAHLAVCLPPLLVCAGTAVWVLRPSLAMGTLLVLTPAAFAAFIAVTGLAVNLRLPKLDWDSETQAVKQSAASMISVLGGMAVTVLLAIPYFIWMDTLTAAVYFAAWAVVLALAAALCLRWLYRRGSACWEAL